MTHTDDTERRKTTRHGGAFPVTIAVAGPLTLDGETVNYSANGVLIVAQGKIPIFVGFNGQNYRGFLVRASSVGDQTSYGIELVEPLQVQDER